MGINLNSLYAVPPHQVPTLVSATSELYRYPKENVLSLSKPGRPWQTAAIDVDQVLQVGVTVGINGLMINRTNFVKALIEKSTNGSTWEYAGPNLVQYSDALSNWTTDSGTVTRTDSYAAGPLTADRLATRCVWGTANAILRSASDTLVAVTSRDFVGSIWLRTTSMVGDTVEVGLRFGNISDTFTTFTLTNEWQRCVVYKNSTGSSTGTAPKLLLRGAGGNEDILAIGAQLTPDVASHLGADYLTTLGNSSDRSSVAALNIRKDGRVDRRKCLVRLGASLATYPYLRFRIIQDQTTDDGDNYKTGALLFTKSLSFIPGRHQFPLTPVALPRKTKEMEFDGGGKEILQLGDRKTIITLRGSHIVRLAEAALHGVINAPIEPFLIDENIRAAGGGMDSTDESRANICWLTGDFQSAYEIPEVFDCELVFEEIL